MSTPKEPNFFYKDLRKKANSRDKYYEIQTMKEYLNLFPKRGYKHYGEASANYLFSRTSATEIYTFNPEAKLIAIFREPVDFLISGYYHRKTHGKEFASTFSKVIELSKERKEGKYIPKNVAHPSFLNIENRTSYTSQLSRFVNLFPVDNIKILVYENFKKNNQKIINKIYDFLNIQKQQLDYEAVNQGRNVNNIGLKILQSKLITKKLAKFLPIKMRQYIKNKIFIEQKEISEELKNQLKIDFKEEVFKFNSFLIANNLLQKENSLLELWGYDTLK